MHKNPHVQTQQLFRYPRDIFKLFCSVLLLSGLQVVIADLSSFLLQVSKNLISDGFITLSLIVFAIYYARDPLRSLIYNLLDEKRSLLDEAETIHLSSIGSEILLSVKDKVKRHDANCGCEETMTSSNILSTLKSYVQLSWKQQLFWYKNSVELISIIIMFVGFLLVSTVEVSNVLFFYLITLFGIAIEVFFRYQWIKIRNRSRKQRRECNMITDNALQDIKELEPFDNRHAKYMIENYVSASSESFKLIRKMQRETNWYRVLHSVLSMFAILGIVSIKVLENGIGNFSLEVLVGAIALVSIYNQLTQRVASIVEIFFDYRELKEEQKVHKEDFDNIMQVYYVEKQKREAPAATLKKLTLPSFDVAYAEESNNTPFRLINNTHITLNRGDFVMLRGVTGSGKTTMINLLTRNLVFDEFKPSIETENEGVVKTLTHQVFISLGTKPLITELTLGKSEYDQEKLIAILKAFHLYEEFEQKNEDVLKLLSSTTKTRFSAGQLQRLALTRTLFNLEDDVQIVAFDESINNLDDGIAQQVLAFIREYCKDKLVVFSSHQVALCKQVANRELVFTNSSLNTYSVKEA